ncbi:hypothetical protein J32TS6_16080 [Virgibacillus pantothenticus]|uniref:hypothetical protein n=1 Tax=Virgibacillus TaxID=84406 RepID=UPI000FFF6879|nr:MULTISPECIES: hypothetical protein [Virgibacillus]MBS7427984.1 hypothetical protein [Virgibacillus sp. 19R1-5]MED3739251.1 hypothetical protein [Virgibacillus pantothenticus]GIP63053.1 hypothetical protein J32TS6_16080 [Virgibacillus pantothenticus]
MLAGWFTFTILKVISKSLGNNDIYDAVKRVINENPQVLKKIIGISIALDHKYKIPHTEIKSVI